VQDLGRFPRTDVDRNRGAELIVAENPVEHAEHKRTGGWLIERPDLAKEGVDPARPAAFEGVAPVRRGGQLGLELVTGPGYLFWCEKSLDDEIPVAFHGRNSGFDVYLRIEHDHRPRR